MSSKFTVTRNGIVVVLALYIALLLAVFIIWGAAIAFWAAIAPYVLWAAYQGLIGTRSDR